MGLGISVEAKLKSAPGAKVPGRDAIFAAIERSLRAGMKDEFDQAMCSFDRQEHEMFALVHPGTEPIFFVWEPGTIRADTKTSTLGPGYHAHVVLLLRRVEAECGLTWDWSADETGYATSEDFSALQEAMADQLAGLAAMVAEHAGDSDAFAVNLALGAHFDTPAYTKTPLGPRGREWWTRAGKDPRSCVRDFYVWWDRERDAAYWAKVGNLLLWTEVRWRQPQDDAEGQLYQHTLACFERAQSLDPRIAVPTNEIEELKILMNAEEPQRPQASGIGYYRSNVTHPLPGDWKISVPGYFYEQFDEETGTVSFWDGTRQVEVFTIYADPEQGPSARELVDNPPDGRPEGRDIRFENESIYARAVVFTAVEEGEELAFVQGAAMAGNTAAIITISLQDTADEPWAENVLCTLMPPSEEHEPDEPAEPE